MPVLPFRSAMASVVGLAAAAHANPPIDVIWIDGSGGSYSDGGNWSTGSMPSSSDRGIFDIGGSRTVDLFLSPTADQARIAHGTWDFDLNGNTWRLLNPESGTVNFMSLQIGWDPGDFASVFLDGPGTVSGEHLVAGVFAGSTALVQVRSGAVLDLAMLRLSALGGSGNMIVTSGSSLFASSALLSQGGTAALAVNSGAEAIFGPGMTIVGRGGAASIEVQGAYMQTAGVILGDGSGDGEIVIGGGADWHATATMQIAKNGDTGAVIVEDNGFVWAQSNCWMAHLFADTSATLDVTNATMWIDGYHEIGGSLLEPGGSATVTVGPGGLIDTLGRTRVYGAGRVVLDGGVIATDTFTGGGASGGTGIFDWSTGLLDIRDSSVVVEVTDGALLGGARSIAAGQDLRAAGRIDVHNAVPDFAYMDVNGGSVDASTIWLGSEPGSRGESWVTDGTLRADVLAVGRVGSEAELRVYPGATVEVRSMLSATGGADVLLQGPGSALVTANLEAVSGGFVDDGGGEILVTTDLSPSGTPGMLVDGLDPAVVSVRNGALHTAAGRVATAGFGRGHVMLGEETGSMTALWAIDGVLSIGTSAGSAVEARVDVFEGSTVSASSAEVRVDGHLELQGGSVSVPLLTCRGRLGADGSVLGDIELHSPSTTAIRLAGTGFADAGRLTVSGDAVISGGLELTIAPGTTASAGLWYPFLMTSGTRSGTFSAVEIIGGEHIAPLVVFPQYFPDQVRVVVTHRADVDRDGDVDVQDLLIVLSAWGICDPGDCIADVNGNGAVEIGDLLEVLANWTP